MKKFNILIIGGNLGEMSSLEEILTTNDYDVKCVMNGKEGLKFMHEESIDLVFIEAQRPSMDGYLTCQSIKSTPVFHNIPVIFIIAGDDLIFIKEIYESGGNDYVLKPLIWSELLMKARMHLELRYSREMSRNMNQILEDKVAQRTAELEDSLLKLSQAKKELDLLSIAKSEFINMISHEIRTPLNGILGSMALIGRYNFSDEVNRYFTLLDKSVKRLEKFSNIILEASTLRLKGEKALKISETNLEKVIQSAIEQCVVKFSEKNIVIDLQNESTNSSLKADQKYLLQCFSAILDNAFKFSQKGQIVEIRINNERNGFLKVTVADSGKGFSKIAMDNIYKPLSNLEAHFDQNTGMGLHLAKLVVDAHSGFISAGNREQKGAIIEIVIPSKL